MAQPSSTPIKTKRDRSPAYPFISLRTAVDRLIALEGKFGRHPAPLDKAGLAWELKPDSSQAAQTLSALKYFGLVEYAGSTENRVAVITDQARNYLRAQQASVKADLLKVFALKPKAMQTYWSRWNADRPIDEVCLDEMMLKDSFTEVAAKLFLRVYDETIAFSGLAETDKAEINGKSEEDYVDEAIPDSLPVTSAPPAQPGAAPKVHDPIQANAKTMPAKGNGMRQEVFALSEGDVTIQWPERLSADSLEDFTDWLRILERKIKRSALPRDGGRTDGEN